MKVSSLSDVLMAVTKYMTTATQGQRFMASWRAMTQSVVASHMVLFLEKVERTRINIDFTDLPLVTYVGYLGSSS